MTVLLVDDHKGIRELEKTIIASMFDTFYESSSGEEAIKIYKVHKPDWVLMDYKMNGMNGIEVVKKIKESDSSAKIIMVTQYDDTDLRKAAFKAGVLGFVNKEKLSAVKNILLINREN
ncbi:MAG: response regulator transcription factor [Ignavibacteriaceae bacterium]|nr:response regulator transcription factor [Ignavibacteriaceae bacterium]